MGRIYTVQFTEVAVSAQQDLFQIEAKVVPATLYACYLSQSSDAGDSKSAMVSIQVRRFTDDVTDDLAVVNLDGGDATQNADVAINEKVIFHADRRDCKDVLMPFEHLRHFHIFSRFFELSERMEGCVAKVQQVFVPISVASSSSLP